jgi:putative YhbY family RNA-binding protein
MNPSTALTLSPTQRRNLRGHAHHLHPLVMIGNDGLTDAVLAAIDTELKHHELIKVRVFGDDRGEREALLEAICKALDCAAVQHIGKLFVLYRAAPSGARLNPDLAYGEALAAKTRKVIEPAGAQLTKKQAAAGKKSTSGTMKAATNAAKKAAKKVAKKPRKFSGATLRAETPAPRAGKYNPVPGTSSTRRTHLSAADRRAAYATVTERAPRPTTKPERATKPRKSASRTTTTLGASVRKSGGRSR